MRLGDAGRGVRHPIAMDATIDVLAHRAAGGVLHRYPFERGTLPQCRLLLFGESQGHGHEEMVPK